MHKKLIKHFLQLSLIALLLLININNDAVAKSRSKNLYLVNNVFVNTSGKNPTEASKNSLIKAQRNAFTILLSRLSIDEAFSDNVTAEEISDMVQAQQITNEKIAGNNYSAIFNIAFSEEFVDQILDNKDIYEDKVKQESYLLFPIKVIKRKSLLWENNNDWRLAWENVMREIENNRGISLPSGDIDDISMIDSDIISNSDYSDFQPILNKYQSNVAIVAYFDFDKIENKVNITLNTIRKFQKRTIKLSFINVNHLNFSELLEQVTNKTIEHISKSRESSNSNSEPTVTIDILLSNLEEWISIKKRLESMNFIEEMNINSIATDLIQVSIQRDSNSGDVVDLFSEYGFILGKKEEGQYFLSLQ